jgi:threonine dehydrogenase-like Zn-dependent dehydrogenase
MKAIAATPGTANSVHLEDLREPRLEDVGGGRGVMVRVLRVGLDGTDREINSAEYGTAPEGSDFLVLGHESLGVVEEVGPNVTEFQPGDYVVCIVRRPGRSIYDLIGQADFTTDDTYYEHGISRLHGFLTERYVDSPEYLILVPRQLADVGVLLEPTSVAEKGVTQAFEIQRRLHVWRPRKAAVLGAGPLGILATMALRVRGLEVSTFGLDVAPYLNSDLVEAIGARYVSTRERSLTDASGELGPFDIIFEATGFSPLVFEAMQVLGRNGVLVLSSVTGGDRQAHVPADKINLSFVLGNKVAVGTVNASRADFESGVRDLAMAEARWPGWLRRLLTHKITGLDNYQQAFQLLGDGQGAIKIVVEV